MDNVVPSRTVCCFATNKPWVITELKALLKQKKSVFNPGGKEELKQVQSKIPKIRIKEAKERYGKMWRAK